MTRQVIDARHFTGWHGEALALRKRIFAGIESRMRAKPPTYTRPTSDQMIAAYAAAMGWEGAYAQRRTETQETLLALAAAPPPAQTARRLIDATGPTSWDRTSEGKRLRARILSGINKRVQTGAPDELLLNKP